MRYFEFATPALKKTRSSDRIAILVVSGSEWAAMQAMLLSYEGADIIGVRASPLGHTRAVSVLCNDAETAAALTEAWDAYHITSTSQPKSGR